MTSTPPAGQPANDPGSKPANKPTKPRVKNAHMVSSGYISAWADDDKAIDVLDLEQGVGYHTSYKRATVVNYVYEPAFLEYDLEGEYARIESAGIRVIKMLRDGLAPTIEERSQLIACLEMYRYRGRYADRSKIRVPAVAAMKDGTAQNIELKLGDMTLLTRGQEPGPILTEMNLENQDWVIWTDGQVLPTGDGAVMLWGSGSRSGSGTPHVEVVSFILSPTQVLVMGNPPTDGLPIIEQLLRRSMRWIVGKKGTLRYSQAKVIADERAAERAAERPAAQAEVANEANETGAADH